MDVIKVCENCKGDGFWRQKTEDVHPYQNVAHALAIYSDGKKMDAVCCRDYRPFEQPTSYEFKCIKCNGTGEFTYRRGVSLVPLIP